MVESKARPTMAQGSQEDLTCEERRVLVEVLAAMRTIHHGYIQLTVQNARVIQIDRTEKHRLV